MKKIIAVIVVLVLFAPLTACFNGSEVDIENNDNRITLIYNDGFCRIYVDNETGIQYINNGGICVMVDENGNPLVYRQAEKGGDAE